MSTDSTRVDVWYCRGCKKRHRLVWDFSALQIPYCEGEPPGLPLDPAKKPACLVPIARLRAHLDKKGAV